MRLLVVGEDADTEANRLRAAAGPGWELRAVRLPAAALRTLEDWSPDAILLAVRAARRNAWIEAIRGRPLGQLVPLLMLGGSDARQSQRDDDALDVVLSGDASARAVLDAAEGELSGRPSPHDKATTRAPATERRGYSLEPVDSAGSTASDQMPPAATKPAVDRKLEEVRHSDYFAILELEPTADRSTIQRAYRRLKRQFERDRLADTLLNERTEALDEIHEALDDALAVLSDDGLRSAYLNARKRK